MRRKAMKTGRFIWHDLMTLDAARARAFYAELFGWNLVPLSMGGFKIHLIEHTGRRIGAIMPEQGIASSHWVPYLAVEDTDRACQRAAGLGAQVCTGAVNVPKLGRFALVEDPQGALFSPLKRPAETPAPPPLGSGMFVRDELHTSSPEEAAQ